MVIEIEIGIAIDKGQPAVRHHLAGTAEPVPFAADLCPGGFVAGAVGFAAVPVSAGSICGAYPIVVDAIPLVVRFIPAFLDLVVQS